MKKTILAAFLSAASILAAQSLPTTNLAVWLNPSNAAANGSGVITSWTDSNGSGVAFAGSSGPSLISGWNNLPAARFYPGSTTNLESTNFPALTSNNLTIFAVVDRHGDWFRSGESANSSGAYGVILEAGACSACVQLDFYGDDGQFGGPLDQFSRTSLHAYQGAANANQEPSMRTFAGPALVGAVFSSAGNTYYSDSTTTSAAAWGSSNTTSATAWLGATSGGVTYNLYGDVYELVVYNTALSGTELSQVLAYFSAKYPLNRSKSTQVIFDGNSLMDGLWASGNSQAYLYESATNEQYNVVSEAIGYYDTETLNSDAPLVIDAYASSSYTKQIVALWEIHNSIANRGDTAAQVETALTNYVTGRHAHGFKVVLATCLDSTAIGNGTAMDTTRNAVNAWIRAGSSGADAIADVASDSAIGCEGCYSNTSYFYSDGIHLNTAGQQKAQPYFTAAITGLLAPAGDLTTTLSPITIGPNQVVEIPQQIGIDVDGNTETLTALSASIDNYTFAYIAGSAGGPIYVIPRTTAPAGGSVTVNVTLNAKDVNGDVLPALVQQVQVQGPSLQAVIQALPSVPTTATYSSGMPGDPGSATLTY